MSTVRHLTSSEGRAPVVARIRGTDDRLVWLSDRPAPGPEAALLRTWAGAASRGRGDVQAGLRLALEAGRILPAPGSGSTMSLWSALATLGAADLTIARVVEPHLDALAIMAQLDSPPDLDLIGVTDTSTWGVFAAEGGRDPLQARPDGEQWVLQGTKPWCSLAAELSHALVTAWVPSGARRTFAVALDSIGLDDQHAPWHARGLPAVTSGPISFHDVRAVPVGADNWYLTRPGFAWGGIGVAACWYGGAVGVARALMEQARSRELDQVGLMHLGAVDEALYAARCLLRDAAAQVDAGRAREDTGRIAALRVRGRVAATVEEVLTRAGHALGPGPLCFHPEHAGRVADLQVYVRQEHAERDQAALGRALLDNVSAEPPGRPESGTTTPVDGWPW